MEDRYLCIASFVLMNVVISLSSQDISTLTGESSTLRCPITTQSDVKFLYWKKDGVTIYYSGHESNGNYSVTDRTSLVIAHISNKDAGNYSCKIVHKSLNTEESDVIRLYVTDLTVSHCSSSSPLEALENGCSCHVDGTNITSLVCTASGFPYSPAITWTHNGQFVGFFSADLKQFQGNVTLICNAWDKNVASVAANKTVCVYEKKEVGPSEPRDDKASLPTYAIVLIILTIGIIFVIFVSLCAWTQRGQLIHLPDDCRCSVCPLLLKCHKSHAKSHDEDDIKSTTEGLVNSHQYAVLKSSGPRRSDKDPAQIEVTDNESYSVAGNHLPQNEITDLEFHKVYEGMKTDDGDNDSVDIGTYPTDHATDVTGQQRKMAVYQYKSNRAEDVLSNLEVGLTEMPTDMRLFSLAMRSLYADRAVGGTSEAAIKFRKLRDNTRDDAMVYIIGVFPVAIKFVSIISEFFEYYTALSFEEWCEELEEILQETSAFKGLAEALVIMHEDILVSLKKREDEATEIVHEITNLQQVYLQKKAEFEESEEKRRSWAIGLAFSPIIGTFASLALHASADSDLVEAIAKGVECEIQESAAVTIKLTLVPALKSFIDGLQKAAGFFSVMEQELVKFEDEAKKAADAKKEMAKISKLHYKVINKEAQKMDQLCRRFYAVLPGVRTDFLAIPSTGTDKSYVDRWLEEQKKIIQKKVGTGSWYNNVVKAITDGMNADPEAGSAHNAE